MSWRGGAGRSGFSRGGGSHGGFSRGGRGRGVGNGGFRGRGGLNRFEDYGPPDTVIETGVFEHPCQGEMVYRMTAIAQVPKFNAPVYLENKTQIGKVEEVLGPISEVYFSVKPVEGVQASSFKHGDKVYMGADKLMPLQRFTSSQAPPKGIQKPAGGPGFRGGRGGRGRGRGGSGNFRGGFGRGRGGAGPGRGRFSGSSAYRGGRGGDSTPTWRSR